MGCVRTKRLSRPKVWAAKQNDTKQYMSQAWWAVPASQQLTREVLGELGASKLSALRHPEVGPLGNLSRNLYSSA